MEEAFRADYKKAIEGVSSPVEFEVYLYRRCFQAESTITHLEARIKELEGYTVHDELTCELITAGFLKSMEKRVCTCGLDNLLNKGTVTPPKEK